MKILCPVLKHRYRKEIIKKSQDQQVFLLLETCVCVCVIFFTFVHFILTKKNFQLMIIIIIIFTIILWSQKKNPFLLFFCSQFIYDDDDDESIWLLNSIFFLQIFNCKPTTITIHKIFPWWWWKQVEKTHTNLVH